MSNLRRVMLAVLAIAVAAALVGGCSLFKAKDESEKPETTSSAMSSETPSTEPAAPPAETYVEPARPWGAETRDNLVNPTP